MFTDEQLHHPILTREQEVELGQRIQAGDCDALDQLVLHNLRLVYKLARKWNTDDPATDFDDLVQEGMMGLLTAAQKYDPARENKFSTYAHYWIEQKISRCVIVSGPIRRSANPNQLRRRESVIRDHAVRQAPVARLDAPLRDRRGDDMENTLSDILADMSQSVEDQVLSAIEVERILDELSLSPRGQAVIDDWFTGYSREEAAKKHGFSRSWIYARLCNMPEKRKERIMSRTTEPTCIEPGCTNPRWRNETGTLFPRCDFHQHEFWTESKRAAKAAARHLEAADAHQPEPASRDVGRVKFPQSNGSVEPKKRGPKPRQPVEQTGIDRTFHDLERQPVEPQQPGTLRRLIQPLPPTQQQVDQAVQETMQHTEQLIGQLQEQEQIHQPESPDGCTCPDCIYREVISLLAARNPRISQLVDTLLYARQLRDDLGI